MREIDHGVDRQGGLISCEPGIGKLNEPQQCKASLLMLTLPPGPIAMWAVSSRVRAGTGRADAACIGYKRDLLTQFTSQAPASHSFPRDFVSRRVPVIPCCLGGRAALPLKESRALWGAPRAHATLVHISEVSILPRGMFLITSLLVRSGRSVCAYRYVIPTCPCHLSPS